MGLGVVGCGGFGDGILGWDRLGLGLGVLVQTNQAGTSTCANEAGGHERKRTRRTRPRAETNQAGTTTRTFQPTSTRAFEPTSTRRNEPGDHEHAHRNKPQSRPISAGLLQSPKNYLVEFGCGWEGFWFEVWGFQGRGFGVWAWEKTERGTEGQQANNHGTGQTERHEKKKHTERDGTTRHETKRDDKRPGKNCMPRAQRHGKNGNDSPTTCITRTQSAHLATSHLKQNRDSQSER